MSRKAKLEMETLGKILLLTVFLIIFLLMFKGCQDQMKNVGTVGANEYICWLSQAMKADLSFLFPSACNVIDVEKPQNVKGISSLMRKCWWMHGQGEKDIPKGFTERYITWFSDVARVCYVFTPEIPEGKYEISLKELGTYLRTHDRSGNKVNEDSPLSAWGYIQKGAKKDEGICFDKKLEGKLVKDKRYFIIFYDDKAFTGTGVRDLIIISRDPTFGEKKASFFSFLNEKCESWQDMLEEETAEGDAIIFFNDLITALKKCSKVSSDQRCICGSDLEGVRGYALEIEMLEEKKYKVSLLKGGKLFEKEGKKFTEEIEGRIGDWSLVREPCYPYIIGKDSKTKSPYIISSLEHQYIIFDPNNNPEPFRNCKDNSGTYFINSALVVSMSLKDCFSAPQTQKEQKTEELEVELKKKEEEDRQLATQIFNEVSSKFENCFQTKITDSCMCDNSETDLTNLPGRFSIKLKKIVSKNYEISLYDAEKKETVAKGEKSLSIDIGLISVAEQELQSATRSEISPFCNKGLGLVDSLSLDSRYNTKFSLVNNIDSRFYLQAFAEDISPCTSIQKDFSGNYKGLYSLSLRLDKTPVLKYCSGKPVSEQAAEELKRLEIEKQKAICESYTESECYDHLDKCYPYVPLTKFASCKYCGDDFKCEEILSRSVCKLNPCKQTCEWQKVGLIEGCLTKNE